MTSPPRVRDGSPTLESGAIDPQARTHVRASGRTRTAHRAARESRDVERVAGRGDGAFLHVRAQHLLARLRALPIENTPGAPLRVAMADPTDLNAYDEVTRLTRREIDLAVVAEGGVFADQARKGVARDYRQTAWVGTVTLDGATAQLRANAARRHDGGEIIRQ